MKKSLIKKLRLVLVLALFLFALGETTLYSQENTETTPYTLDLFWGNKIIGNISTTLNTTGITLDYLLLPDYNISIIGSYLTSKRCKYPPDLSKRGNSDGCCPRS